MADHLPRTIERHCDVAVVGGSAAGLGGALQLARQRWSVIVVDAGEPRNRPAGHVHGYLTRDGATPAELLEHGREEVRRYGGEVLQGRAVQVTRRGDRFRVDLTGGHSVVARKVLAATGVTDDLPALEGIEAHWGEDVIHCPFCHGFEARDRRIVQLVTHPMGLHTAELFRQLTNQLVVVLEENLDVDQGAVDLLRSADVDVRTGSVLRIVDGDDGHVSAVELRDGRRIQADVVAVGPSFRVRSEPFGALGLETTAHPSGLGDFVGTDPTGATSVPGLYAAGNLADPSQQVLQAAADGSRVGAMISFELAHEGLLDRARSSAHQADWDHRYGEERIWSGNPNGSLVAEIGGVTPGRALDVGAGEGGDAMWLAEQDWRVSANDISLRALERIAGEARRRDLHIELLPGDANGLDIFETEAFDLVTAHYASIPRTPDQRGVRNLVDAVAPGGTLLIVSHDLEPMRHPVDTLAQSRAFDPDAYVRTEDFVAYLTSATSWQIVVHETRPRPPGAASAAHHVDDVVLRARRAIT